MLEMDETRISFADALRPPEGYVLSFATGTTYTLDLRALLGICIPLGLGFEPEALDSINPVSLFASLKRLQGRLVIYCDKGSMRADIQSGQRSSSLLMLLEGMVHQVHVNRRRKDALSSFHPKVWVIEYASRNGDDPLYRLLVMSRNLTFDTSWDALVAIDGHPGEGNDCSMHLANFLEFLANGDSQTSTDRDDTRKRGSHTSRMRKLAETIRSVEFSVDDRTFDSVDFLPFGPHVEIDGPLMDARACDLMTLRWRSMLVISPFLSDGDDSPLAVIARHRSGMSGRYVLLSREDSLSSLKTEIRDAYECFCPQPSLADVELDGCGGADASDYSNLHAKIYFSQDVDARRSLYIGSLNASRNGTYNNVEALLRLGVRPGRLTFQQMLRPLIGDGSKQQPPFSPYIPSALTDEETEDDDFRRAFRIASRLVSFRAVRVSLSKERFACIDATVEVASANKACGGISLALRPLLSGGEQPLPMGTRVLTRSLTFDGLDSTHVSAFFVISGTDAEGHRHECVTVCPHSRFDDSELSLESRSKSLIGAILSEGGGTLAQYLAHAFDLPEAAYSTSTKDLSMEGPTSSPKALPVPYGLYERLLDMADTNPAVFEQASYLIGLIPDDVVEDELDALRALVETFSKAVG